MQVLNCCRLAVSVARLAVESLFLRMILAPCCMSPSRMCQTAMMNAPLLPPFASQEHCFCTVSLLCSVHLVSPTSEAAVHQGLFTRLVSVLALQSSQDGWAFGTCEVC